MKRMFLLGDEALAQGALDAGISGAYAYPGTPSTEILEYVQRTAPSSIHSRWSTNEKTALEAALGMSYAGKRALVSMKHVGLNVAADPFINAGISGANGGLVIAVADDPSMHSSQNEQDSRFYGEFANVPVLEPSTPQEAYDMAGYAFELSERYHTPVLVRLVTRLAHSRAPIERGKPRHENELHLPADSQTFILLPQNARRNYARLVLTQSQLVAESEVSAFSRLVDGNDRSVGIIAAGLGYAYVRELFPNTLPHPVLKVSQYPLPTDLVAKFVNECGEVVVVEDGYPFIEARLRGFTPNPRVHGRLDGTLPRTGELTPEAVAAALGVTRAPTFTVPDLVVPRPPALCPGCPHADTFRALVAALGDRGRVFSDIGCYTLGALPPYEAVDTCIEMGASIGMAKGAADAGLHPAVAVIGDSTFTHSGMTGLLDCVQEGTPITVIILDNLAVAMTGGQPSQATNRLENICRGIGVAPDHVRVIVPIPSNHDENVRVLQEEIAYRGLSVVIARRECVQTAARRARQRKRQQKPQHNPEAKR